MTIYATTNDAVKAAAGATVNDRITAALGIAPVAGDEVAVDGEPGDLYVGAYVYAGDWRRRRMAALLDRYLELSSRATRSIRTRVAQFEDGYMRQGLNGMNALVEQWDLQTIPLVLAERRLLECATLGLYASGEPGAFTWQAPGDDAPKRWVLARPAWTVEALGRSRFSLSMAIERSYGPMPEGEGDAAPAAVDLCYLYCRWNGSAMEVWEHKVVADEWSKLGELPWNLLVTNALTTQSNFQDDWRFYYRGFYFVTPELQPYDSGYPVTTACATWMRQFWNYGDGTAWKLDAYYDYGAGVPIGPDQFPNPGANKVINYQPVAPRFWQIDQLDTFRYGVKPAYSGSGANLVITPRVGQMGRGVDARLLPPLRDELYSFYPTGRWFYSDDNTYPPADWWFQGLCVRRQILLSSTQTVLKQGTRDPWAFETGDFAAAVGALPPSWTTGALDFEAVVPDLNPTVLQGGWVEFTLPTFSQILSGQGVFQSHYLTVSGSLVSEAIAGVETLPSASHRGAAIGEAGILGQVLFDCGGGDRFAATNIMDSSDPNRGWFINGVAAVHNNRRLMKLYIAEAGTIPQQVLDVITERNAGGDWYQFGHPSWSMDGTWWPCACAVW